MKDQVAHLVGPGSVSNNKGKPSKKDNKKDKAFIEGPESQIQKEKKCFFCKKMRHFKKDSLKRKACLTRKVEVPLRVIAPEVVVPIVSTQSNDTMEQPNDV
ncbi:hypothetical protein V2J09_023041 [Rumex salicifolius]